MSTNNMYETQEKAYNAGYEIGYARGYTDGKKSSVVDEDNISVHEEDTNRFLEIEDESTMID